MPRSRRVHISRPASNVTHATLSVVPDSPELIRARRLKEKIERYWGARGHMVRIRVEETHLWLSRASMPHRDYVVRSDLVNGLPAQGVAP